MTVPTLQVETQRMIPNEKHLGFQESNLGPEGVIPRIQKQVWHQKFVQNNPYLDEVMLGIDDAERLLNKGHVISSYFSPNVTSITTSTIHDQPLGELRWTREENIVRAASPDYHIPTDYWVYGDMDPEDRETNIEFMMEGTEWFSRQLTDSSTQVLPLVSGTTPEERQICYRTFEKLDVSYCAVYGAQYFGGEMGNGINKLNSYIRDIVSEYPLDGVLLIGLQSADYLQRMPPEVVGAAGQRWIDKSRLRDLPINESKKRFKIWKQAVEKSLGRGNATIGSFNASNGVTA